MTTTCCGYYVTEDRGQAVKLLATSKELRESIPWHSVEEVVAYLRSQASDDEPLLVMGDDGEKFGSWPGTYDHVWKQGWMKRFFEALQDNSDWLKTTTVSDYIDAHRPLGRVYVPSASYEEMMEWALPPEASERLAALRKGLQEQGDPQRVLEFLRGGSWRNFLAKYSEVNILHKKVLRVHQKLVRAEAARARAAHATRDGLDESHA